MRGQYEEARNRDEREASWRERRQLPAERSAGRKPEAARDVSHVDVTKSMDTGTPSSLKRPRSSFSTQYA